MSIKDWFNQWSNARIEVSLNKLEKIIMALNDKVDTLVEVVATVVSKVAAFAGAVDVLEAKVTEALKNVNVDPATQAKLDQAI